MSETPNDLMQAALEVARRAGRAAQRHFRSALVVDAKPDGSPVTIADHQAETIAREWIEAHFPKDGILGEEFGETRPEAARRWLIDPIDGTQSFIHGVPLWGTLIAVVEGERVVAGVAHFPALRESLAAATGCGCWWNEGRCQVSEVSDLADATALVTDGWHVADPERRAGWERLARRTRISRTWGDCYGYLMVATGRAEVMVDPTLSPWDAAPLAPIIEEAGGVFTDWSGAPTAFGGSAVATNLGIAEEARRLLAGAGAPQPGEAR